MTAFNHLVETRYGLMLCNRNDYYIGGSLAAYGEYSQGEAAMFAQLLAAGQLVVEAGANIGTHTIHLARLVGERGAVYAFEPQRIVFQTLCANIALNQCINVVARQQGVGQQAGRMIVPEVDPRVQNNFGGIPLLLDGPGEKVDVVRIDDLELPRCDFIKVDVEGMEEEVILGASATIAEFRPSLYIENDRVDKSAALLGLLLSLGYRLWWHLPPLFNPDNYAKNATNIFGSAVSVNILCLPAEFPRSVADLREIKHADDRWDSP